jgi:hypothetical protein
MKKMMKMMIFSFLAHPLSDLLTRYHVILGDEEDDEDDDFQFPRDQEKSDVDLFISDSLTPGFHRLRPIMKRAAASLSSWTVENMIHLLFIHVIIRSC